MQFSQLKTYKSQRDKEEEGRGREGFRECSPSQGQSFRQGNDR